MAIETRQPAQPDNHLLALLYPDLGAITRARVALAKDLPQIVVNGVGCTPLSQALTPLDGIPADNPFGARGDLRLMPDLGTEVDLRSVPGAGGAHLVLCDAVTLDMKPWSVCPRNILKSAVADLREETSLRLLSSFEHEFTVVGLPGPAASAKSAAAIRQIRSCVEQVMDALCAAGLRPELWYPELGPFQHECTIAPTEGVRSADHAVLYREIVREVFAEYGLGITFTPAVSADQMGNGVHVHLSLLDPGGAPVLYAPAQPGALSPIGAQFAAGIARHMPALTAFTAASPVSSVRMQPGRFSPSHPSISIQDREASLRICPAIGKRAEQRAASYNLEYRACDATANPYLVLAVLLRAGLAGITGQYELPHFASNPIAAGGREKLAPLPRSVPEALTALAADPVVLSWFSDEFLSTYRAMKRAEHEQASRLDNAERLLTYTRIY